jgi:hypothetical protein
VNVRDLVKREGSAWFESIDPDSNTQDHALYRPGQVMQCFCALALIEAGFPEPDPMACERIEVDVDRYADDASKVRSGARLEPITPGRFAEGKGRGYGALGALAPDEWGEHGIAVVWWRPRKGAQLCRYLETDPGADLTIGEPAENRWRETYLPVLGPPIPNNHCPAPHQTRPWWPWTHAADRQLDLLGAGQG